MTVLLQNKKARGNYEIMDTHEAGIKLLGLEVKSLRNKHGSIDKAHITVRGGEAYILNMHIPPYQPVNTDPQYDAYRNRKLLLNKKELSELAGLESQKGLTIIPLSLYNKGRNLKLEIAVVRGLKKHDKREVLKKRESDRDINRTLKQQKIDS